MNTPGIQSDRSLLQLRRVDSAQEALRDRLFTIASVEQAPQLADLLDTEREGLIVTGVDRHLVVQRLRRVHPNLVIAAESSSHVEWHATLTSPFYVPADQQASLLPARTVSDDIADQRAVGGSFVILPAGYLAVGDVQAARAVVEAANAISGDDIALPLYLDGAWLSPEHAAFLGALIETSKHPVLLAFGAKKNPLESKKRLKLYIQVASHGAVCWRTDLAGLAAVAHGAVGAAIGAGPGLRRVTPPTEKGNARSPHDRTPYAIIPGHMHYMKTGAMRDEVYIGNPAPNCPCRICNGRRVDRFAETDAVAAARHNHEVLAAYAEAILGVAPPERVALWRGLCQDALVAHEATGAVIGRQWKAPLDVQTFAEL